MYLLNPFVYFSYERLMYFVNPQSYKLNWILIPTNEYWVLQYCVIFFFLWFKNACEEQRLMYHQNCKLNWILILMNDYSVIQHCVIFFIFYNKWMLVNMGSFHTWNLGQTNLNILQFLNQVNNFTIIFWCWRSGVAALPFNNIIF